MSLGYNSSMEDVFVSPRELLGGCKYSFNLDMAATSLSMPVILSFRLSYMHKFPHNQNNISDTLVRPPIMCQYQRGLAALWPKPELYSHKGFFHLCNWP